MKPSPAARCWLALAAPVALTLLLVGAPAVHVSAPLATLASPPSPTVTQREAIARSPAAAPVTSAIPFATAVAGVAASAPVGPSAVAPTAIALSALRAPVPALAAPAAPIIASWPPSVSVPGAQDARFATVDQDLADGETDSAKSLLQQLATAQDRPVAARAQFLLARTLLGSGDAAGGAQALRDYLARYPAEADAPLASLVLAEQLRASGQVQSAIPLYQAYLDHTTDHVLDGYALLVIADSRSAAGQTDLSLYRRAIAAGLAPKDETAAAARVAASLSGDARAVASWYGSLAGRPEVDPSTRAHYQVLAADADRRAGQTASALALYRQVVADAASAGDTLAAISALLSLGAPVDGLSAGEALLKSGRYADAVAAFGNVVDENAPMDQQATARYERGQALLTEGAAPDAANQLRKFIAVHPGDPRIGDAALLAGKALDESGDADGAIAFLEGFVHDHPKDPAASRALWQAVGYLKTEGKSSEVAHVEDQIINVYASSDEAPRAAFDRGWDAYANNDEATARQLWESVRERWPTSPGSDAALLWLGKLEQRAGDLPNAQRDYALAWNANPGDFYAFRGHELLAATHPAKDGTTTPPDDPAADRADFETWLAVWTHTEPSTPERPYLGSPIGQGTTLARISALYAAGLADDADREVKQELDLYGDDPRALYAIADTLSQCGQTTRAMKVAYELLMISPAPNAFQSPIYLQRLVYPYPYRDLIEAAAQQSGIDPLLLVALMRQESDFNPRAQSAAGAAGLTQMMPSTAQGMATSLGMATFTSDQLFRPAVAIRLSAAYLAAIVREFNGNPYLALAAYNAGSGNVHQWLAANPRHDVDLLAEQIPFQETRDYLRNVYRYYQEYQFVYRSSG